MVPPSYQYPWSTVGVPVARLVRFWKPPPGPRSTGQHTFEWSGEGASKGAEVAPKSLQIAKKFRQILKILPEELDSK